MRDNPSLEIELGSHTDSRGKDSYNLALSQRRAQSVVNYLVSKGISRMRMKAKGYGETQLLNGCEDGVPCTDEQHQENRRTVFKVLKY
ncbi:Photosystem I chlorophyll a apoprotein A2 [compost metagenome]